MTGLFLSFQFVSDKQSAFSFTLGLSQVVNGGWLLRIVHSNGGSLFFICLYLHLGRGIIFGSYIIQETWGVGVLILFCVMGAAFLGYVLPWGQISF